MGTKDGGEACGVGWRDVQLAVEAAWPRQRRVEMRQEIGRGQEHDPALGGTASIDPGEKRRHDACPPLPRPGIGDGTIWQGVDLIEEEDARR